MSSPDHTTNDRKKDHIDLAFQSRVHVDQLDTRFDYEPALHGHPLPDSRPWDQPIIAGKKVKFPLWVSSMTGGTAHAKKINANLAIAAKAFGMGLGLGSCRILLDSDRYLEDFRVRPLIGADLPLFANLGIAQVQELISSGNWNKVTTMMDKIDADGLIIHLNPMQEWLQPEGDRYFQNPIDTIKEALRLCHKPIMVKEVGQGFGPESLRELLHLPLEAIEFGAAGGTNFALLEALRGDEKRKEAFLPLTKIGHSAHQMIEMTNQILDEIGENRNCKLAIVSGGLSNFLDGYYGMKKLNMPSIYAQASALLKSAVISSEELSEYLQYQKEGLQMAYQYLRVK